VRLCAPFLPADLEALDALYQRAGSIVRMDTVFDALGNDIYFMPGSIAVRHDCDNVIHPAVRMASWERDRGYTSTYYILHTSPYWQDKDLLRRSCESIAELGHEIGIHNDAITVALETGRDPAEVLHEVTDELRSYGHTIRSTVAHGNHLCRVHNYVNDEMFDTCYRDDYGSIERLGFNTTPLSAFGLEFDANWLPRGDYLSDSGGRWSQDFDQVAHTWPAKGQLHMLVHPDWWAEAFERVAA
jgi:hypothetical protein